jgi:hypothetical protein
MNPESHKYHIFGDDYFHGHNGKEQSEEKAVECWLKGAELGSVQCMKNLSWAYLHGRGVKANALQSGHWGNMATKTVRANHGNNLGGQERERVRQEERRTNTKIYPCDIEVGENDLVLLTQYYVDKECQMREAENDLALKRNIQNPSIKKIVLFLEEDIDIPFKSDKVERVIVHDRTTYKDGFEYMAGKPGVKLMANSDIYFEPDIIELIGADLTNRLLCMTRHDLEPDGEIVGPKPCKILGIGDPVKVRFTCSSDAWIWRDLPPFRSDIYLGVYCCENLMLTNAVAKGIEVINIGKLYNAIHVHWSEKRPQVNEEGVTFYEGGDMKRVSVAESWEGLRCTKE